MTDLAGQRPHLRRPGSDGLADARALSGRVRRTARVAGLVAGREARARAGSPGPWLTLSLACAAAAVYGSGFVASFRTETVLVSADPLASLNTAVVSCLAVLSGARAAASLAWEREHRTLDVLLSGPGTVPAVVLGKFAAEVLTVAVLVAAYAAYLLVAQPLGRGVADAATLSRLGRAVLSGLPMVAAGLALAGVARTVRGAVVAYLAAAGLLAGLSVFGFWLGMQPPQSLSLPLLYVRAALSAAGAVLQHVSPPAYALDTMREAAGVLHLGAGRLAGAVALAGALVLIAMVLPSRATGVSR